MINSRGVVLLDDDRMFRQLIGLERQTSRIGKDTVDHPRGGHDDVANAAAGALVLSSIVVRMYRHGSVRRRHAGLRRRCRGLRGRSREAVVRYHALFVEVRPEAKS